MQSISKHDRKIRVHSSLWYCSSPDLPPAEQFLSKFLVLKGDISKTAFPWEGHRFHNFSIVWAGDIKANQGFWAGGF